MVLLRLFCLGALLAVLPAAASPAALAQTSWAALPSTSLVERVSIQARADGLGEVVRIHLQGRVRSYAMQQNGDAVELLLNNADVARGLRQTNPRGTVEGYRVDRQGRQLVVRVDLQPGATAQVYPDLDSDDILISVTRQQRRAAQTTGWGGGLSTAAPRRRPARRVAQPEPEPVTASLPAAVEAPLPQARETGAASAEGSTVPIRTHWQLDTIVLDAGHGGDDHGGVGNGTSDKEVAWGVVSRLGPMLERELGVRVVYTRDDDTFVELRERGRIANRAGGKLFISVHANAGPATAHGTETFFLAARKSDNARSVMERENGVIELESDPSLYDHFDVEGDILQALAMSAYQEESQLLATLVEDGFRRAGRHSRGVKQGPFLVLWAASMPAILVETGFVTNPDEARHISSRAGLDESARVIFEAVREYKARYDRGLRLAGGE